MERQKKDRSQRGSPLPPAPRDVLACWQWYDEMAADDALPDAYPQFARKLESLQAYFSDPLLELKWRHALRAQLGAMWEQFSRDKDRPQPTKKKAGRGRPAHFKRDFTFHMCVLDTILLRLFGAHRTQRKQSEHWKVMTKILIKFFPHQCREETGWTIDRVKSRATKYLRLPQGRDDKIKVVRGFRDFEKAKRYLVYGPKEMSAVVEARSESMERLIECIDAHLRTGRQQRPARTPPSVIHLGVDGLAFE